MSLTQREDGWCESLWGREQVAREPAEMKRTYSVSFRRLSPLSLVESTFFDVVEKVKSGGTASFRPDTKGRFLFFEYRRIMYAVQR